MKFYTKTHQYYRGIDLHAKNLYVCILDSEGDISVHKNSKTSNFSLPTGSRSPNQIR